MSRYAIRTAGDAVTSYFEFKRYSEESSHAIRTPRCGRRLFTPPAVNRLTQAGRRSTQDRMAERRGGARLPEITRDHPRSPQITPDHPR